MFDQFSMIYIGIDFLLFKMRFPYFGFDNHALLKLDWQQLKKCKTLPPMNLYCWKNHKIRLIYLKISSTSLANSRAEMKLERILLNLKKKNQAIIWPLKVSKKESSNRHPSFFFS